jgi:hypothetical protein
VWRCRWHGDRLARGFALEQVIIRIRIPIHPEKQINMPKSRIQDG